MDPILKKMFYKDYAPVLLLEAPPEFKAHEAGLKSPIHRSAKGSYPFVIAFMRSQKEAKGHLKVLSKACDATTVLWMAYPKGTSKKYKGTDINRDSGHALMQEHGYDGVSLVALDEDWSAMRFKVLAKKG